MAKLTLQEIKSRLDVISPNIEILSKEYVNSKTHLECRCKLDEYRWKAAWSNLSKGKGCPLCKKAKLAEAKRLNIDIVKEKLKSINSNIEILSTKYVNSRQKLECKCLIDGSVWYTSWQNLSQGGKCNKCSRINTRLSLTVVKERIKDLNPSVVLTSEGYDSRSGELTYRCLTHDYEWSESWCDASKGKICPKCNEDNALNIEKIKERLFFINPNIEVLSDNYKNNTTKLRCKCLLDGYVWNVAWKGLQNGNGCPECSGRRRDYTIKDIREKLFKINPNIEILEDAYVNNRVKMKCKCKVDGYEWSSNWGNLSTGYGCPECSMNRKDYTINIIGEKLKNINPNIKILSTTYKNSSTRLKCKCLTDGCVWDSNWRNLSQGLGCPVCGKGMSYGEKVISDTLNQAKIQNIPEYIFDNLIGAGGRVLRFDFAVFNSGVLTHLIEYDGEFHYKKCNKYHDLNKQKYHDKLKNEYCIKNNIPLIRIPYWEKDNISEILTDIFVCKNLNSKFIVSNNQITGQIP